MEITDFGEDRVDLRRSSAWPLQRKKFRPLWVRRLPKTKRPA